MTEKTKRPALVGVKGMNDILPEEAAKWQWLEAKVQKVMKRFAYQNVRLPIVEHTALFARGLGEATDVVEKEMYTFEDRQDKNGIGAQLSLRPEGTAGLVRAVAEHNYLYDGGRRLYYTGPMFRRERPQRGRYRQFHQIGAEALGFTGAHVDAELILLAAGLWQEIGITDWRLEINSLGQPDERKAHRAALLEYWEQNKEKLDEDALRRMHTNPLRILDSKNPAMQELIEKAPQLITFLGEDSKKHFETVQEILNNAGIKWQINPRLVRGLDYYNLTVFEFITERLGAQGTICGGGRYDYLMQEISGKSAPAVGFALGVERVLELIKEQGIQIPQEPLDAYAIILDEEILPKSMGILHKLRAEEIKIQTHAGQTSALGSFKNQIKKADASGARFAIIFGQDEISKGQISIKSLRDGKGEQINLEITDVQKIAAHLKSPTNH